MWPIQYNLVENYTSRAPNGQPRDGRNVTFYYVRPKRNWTSRSLRVTGNGLHRMAGWIERRGTKLQPSC